MTQEPILPDIQKTEQRKKRRRRLYLLSAFLLPCLLMYIVYFLHGVFPFGGESVLVLDLNAQYVYFFGALRRILHGDASLFYSFSRALGGEFLGIFAYYLSSPLSWIVALFPENMMLDALLVLFTTKCGLCGLTLAYYLDRHNIGTMQSRVLFGTLYALCGYGVTYQHNTMWIDCMYLLPLIALGIEQLISKRKYLLFTLSLAIAIFSNFYIGFMMCIFCFLYYFYAYFCIAKNDCGESKHFGKSLFRMGAFSAIAIGLAACIILPTYYALSFGKTEFSNPVYKLESRFDFLDLVSRLFLNAYDTVRPEGLPIIYCGMLTIILLPLFFLAKKVSLAEKVGTGVLIGFFAFSFSIDMIDEFWHGMQEPNWLNYRYSFMLVFILIIAAAKAFAEIRRFTPSQLCGTTAGWLLTVLICQKVCTFYEDTIVINRNLLCFYLSIIFLCAYAAILALFRNRTYRHAAGSVLLVVICAELLLSGIVTIVFLDDDVVYSTRDSYLKNKHKFEDSADWILENDEGFYRFDKTLHPLINTPMTLGIRGFTNSTSTLNKDTINFLRYMGISSKSHWSKYYGGTPPFDSFLATKYIIADPEYTVPDGYIPRFEGNATTVYENPNALSVAYAVNSDLRDVRLAYPKDYKQDVEAGKYKPFTAYYTPPQRMNAMMGAMLGYDAPVEMFVAIEDIDKRDTNLNYSFTTGHELYKPINADNSASLYYEFTAPTDGLIYFYLPTDYPREASVLVNGKDYGTVLANETDRMIALGYHDEGDELSVALTLKNDRIYIRADEPLFWYIDAEVYTESFAALAENQFKIDTWSDTRFAGTITLPADRTTVFTSIPYDKNWFVWVDGERVETYEMLQALVAFDAAPGEHTLVLRYVPTEFYLGLGISIISAAALIILLLIERRIRKKRSEFTVEIVELPDAAEDPVPEETKTEEEN